MPNKNLQFEKDISELITFHLNRTTKSDEKVDKYIHSKEFLIFSINTIVRAMNFFLKEYTDFLVLSFVIPQNTELNAIEVYSSYHVDIDNNDSLNSALHNHLEFIEEEKVDIILHHYFFYNNKKENRIFLKPNNAAKYYPIYYYKNAA